MLALHIGYAKTATTLLQKRVFPNLPGVNYIGRRYGDDQSAIAKADWVYDFVFQDDICTNDVAEIISNGIDTTWQPSIISHEVLLRPYRKYRLLRRIKRLEQRFGPIKIFVSIRNQVDVILSRCVHDRRTMSYSIVDALDFEGVTQCQWPSCFRVKKRFWEDSDCACKKAGIKFINVPFYNYLGLMCVLTSLFGEDNVHLIVSENFRKDPAQEIRSLTNFLGVEHPDDAFLRSLNNKNENVQRNQSLYEEVRKEFVNTGKRNEVFEYFRDSNRRLSESRKLNLEAHGYY